MKQIEVKIENRTLVVKKLPLGRYAELLKALQNLPKHINGLDGLSNDQIIPKIPTILAESLPDVIALFTIATDLKKEEVEEMGLDEATDVFLAIIEVNNYQAVFEKIKKTFGSLTASKQATKLTGIGGQ